MMQFIRTVALYHSQKSGLEVLIYDISCCHLTTFAGIVIFFNFFFFFIATSNIPLSGPHSNGDFVPKSLAAATHSKLESIKDWSVSTFKCTKQLINERFGRGSKTVCEVYNGSYLDKFKYRV